MIRFFAWAVASLLLIFTARRYLLWVASFFPRRDAARSQTDSIVILVPARNETSLLPRLLHALEQCEYPSHLLHYILINDCSTDETLQLAQAWCTSRPNAQLIDLPTRRGKAEALNAALRVAPPSDLVVAMDADTEPAPDALSWLAGAFADPRVGAACAFPSPGNSHVSVTARYAALERWVYHLVTLAGKDRVGWNPPAIGALCAFRRIALRQIGGFPAATAAEDICVSMALVKSGWRTKWVKAARTREDVPETFDDYRRQRMRWSNGLLESRNFATGLEDLLVALGYADRLILIAALGLVLARHMPFWVPVLYLLAPAIAVVTALCRAQVKSKWSYLLAALLMLAADIGVVVSSLIAQVRNKPVSWIHRRHAVVSKSEIV